MNVTRRTRIVCTVSTPRAGGARPQDLPNYVSGLVAAGMDVARINLSHSGAAAEFAAGRAPRHTAEEALARSVRAAAATVGLENHVGVLFDLQGVKVRLRLPDPLRDAGHHMEAGEALRVRITRRRLPEEFVCDASEGFRASVERAFAASGPLSVAIGDGEPFLRCTAVEDDIVTLEAPERCVLGHGKGVTFRSIHLIGEPPLTEKDRVDLAALVLPALAAGEADFIALSFTQCAADVRRLRSFCAEAQAFFREGKPPADSEDAEILARLAALRPDLAARYTGAAVRPFVVAKVETAEGADSMDDILAEADAVMVARGDLGLHCVPEDVPRLQKRMIRDARRLGRPAIVATQMLESMLTAPEPRRSEATDVFNAVLDGADAVMLSGETATGQRPHEAAATLARIAVAAESWETVHRDARSAWLDSIEAGLNSRRGSDTAVTDRVTSAAVRTAEALLCEAIVAATRSGRTARNLARFDPLVPVVAIVPDGATARSLTLTASVRAVVAPASTGVDALRRGLARAVKVGLLAPGARVVVASARPDDPPGMTTEMGVLRVPS
jgi:pyruvate kinase